ncbi:hypothetical protein ACHAXN_004238 [Cyclotella atomus]
MIEYSRGSYGLSLLFRWNGSCLIKAFIPGLLSVILYLSLYFSLFDYAKDYYYQLFTQEHSATIVFYNTSDAQDNHMEEEIQDQVQEAILVDYLNHPYAIGVLVTSITLLITFRANYGYQRYWEGCTAAHNMMSKFMDATMHAAVFHLQSDKLIGMRPPSFYDWDELNGGRLTRDREKFDDDDDDVLATAKLTTNNKVWEAKNNGHSSDSFREDEDDRDRPQSCLAKTNATLRRRRFRKSINETPSTRNVHFELEKKQNGHGDDIVSPGYNHLLGPPRLDGGWGLIYPNEVSGRPTATYYDINKYPTASRIDPSNTEGFASTKGGRTPSLFLQELAHLSSLMCAVAMTTLRNDLADVESPLGTYKPGQPWPECDPLKLPKEVKRAAYGSSLCGCGASKYRRNVRYVLGMDQTDQARTRYNAARPMLVLGGVSDNEIAFLQRARGPYAKTQLCWCWLSEYVIREHMAGSLGAVGPPIVSRTIHFLSDGMKHYNEARKITSIPFPFVHAQLSAFFIFVVGVCIPFLMNQYANQAWLGGTLTFLVVTCLAGLHEVARELENPFRNAPNDIPLCTMLAMYNESLITMFAGFHPDSYWDESDVLKAKGVIGESENGESDENDAPQLISDVDTPRTESDITETPRSISCIDEKKDDAALSNNRRQSADDVSLTKLREMIEMQAVKIKELQDRIHCSRANGL